MNRLVAAFSKRRHPLAQNRLKTIAAALGAALCLAGNAFAAGSNSVSLAWDPNPEDDIAGYRLQYGTTSGSYPLVVDAGSATAATATGLNQGTTYYFTVVAYNTAGQASSPSAEVAYTVPGTPNTEPTAVPFSITVAEDGQAPATLSGSDPEGDGLAFSIVAAPSKGTLTGTPPNLTYRPSANLNGSDSFSYRVHDGALNSAAATVSISISPVNDAPLAQAKSVAVAEDGQVAVALSGTDVDGDTLTYAVVTSPTKGTLAGTPPNLTYRPSANLTGSDSFTYRVNDGTVNSATATVSIAITPVNDPPVANPRSAATNEDTAVAVVLSGSDPESSPLSYTVVSQPSKGTLSGSAPNLTYTPGLNANGSDSFTFRVNDGSANSAAATVSITIIPVNDPPVANSRTASTTKGTAVPITVTASDVDGNPLTYAVVTQPANGTVTGAGPNYTYTPGTAFTGTDSFTFRANDGTVNSAAATVTVTVATGNARPVAHAKNFAGLKNKAVNVQLSGTDADGQPLSYRIDAAPGNGTLTGTPPNLVYKPAKGWTGEDQFTYVANDGLLDSATATVKLKVKAKNSKPEATPRSAQANQNTALPITVAGTDADADPLTFAIAKGPANGTVSINGAVVTYTPKTGFKGKDRFTFVAHDGAAKSKAAVVDITVVNPNNHAPVAVAQSLSGPPKKAVAVVLSGTDADSDPLTFRVVSPPANGKLGGRKGKLKFKPAAGFTGTVSFTFVANDGTADSAPAAVSITIAEPPSTGSARSVASQAKSLAGGTGILPGLTIAPGAPGELVLTITGAPGDVYTLEHSSDLTRWDEVQPVSPSVTGSTALEVAVPPGASSGFYRLRTP